ncbi:MAG: DUF4352 domain-containing protein [Actinobacteria bacterium]|nr:DUF4352 domain-containing protein [Actinomycetota bacterium]
MKKNLKWVGLGILVLAAVIVIASRVNLQLVRPKTPNANQVGESVTVGKIKWTAANPEKKDELYLDDDPYKAIKAVGVFVTVDLTAELTGGESDIVDSSQFAIVDSKDRVFKPTDKFQAYGNLRSIYLKKVELKAPVTGKAIFDIPSDAGGLKLQISDFRSKSSEKGFIELGF